ncbi:MULTISPECIES: hypothetical protein [Methylobacteriaceae]|jgi:hypothetical protein|uniref:hypothetical protein n=1 Tax=Methylobacterium sp. B4 TaxID=1938755 RepID=UPI000D76C392|nr:hypothetical protein [Methylobacterium sp. B4]PXW60559.1 hypothetical protein BY998_109162 [Methylobacterium sp. B4]
MSQTLHTLSERALAAPSLLRLWDLVEAYVEACDEQGVTTAEGGLDLGELPTFGGDVPAHIGNGVTVRSWDATHILIDRRYAAQRFVLVPRSAYA